MADQGTPAAGEAAAPAEAPTGRDATASLDLLLDVPLRITVELGGTRLSIRELLQLGHGSVVELDKPGGEPLDVYVNGKAIARGEAVIVNEKFGVRLTEIVSQTARVERLR
jgi:flagellar motor switch protein FliN/FliY